MNSQEFIEKKKKKKEKRPGSSLCIVMYLIRMVYCQMNVCYLGSFVFFFFKKRGRQSIIGREGRVLAEVDPGPAAQTLDSTGSRFNQSGLWSGQVCPSSHMD